MRLEEDDEAAIMVVVKGILIDATFKREEEKVSLYCELLESLKKTRPTNGSYAGLEKWKCP